MHRRFNRPRFLAAWVAFAISISIIVSGREAEAADTIYFKDGMRTMCHGMAWEEKDEVRCEYDGGILIYPKADVIRIEKGPVAVPETASEEIDEAQRQPTSGAVVPAEPKPVFAPSPKPGLTAGILFYDPRRPERYWSSENRHHASYREAVNALAEEFERPAQWVETHMGDSNDLAAIRENLNARMSGDATASDSATAHQGRESVEFYNPRRQQKYWTGPEARHDTFKEAVETLAVEFNLPAELVETHMGDSNDTELIRQSLRAAKHAQQSK